jgi:hypothetical protein
MKLVNKTVPKSFIDVIASIFKMPPSVYVWRHANGSWLDLNMEPFMPREEYSVISIFEIGTIFLDQQASVFKGLVKVWSETHTLFSQLT